MKYRLLKFIIGVLALVVIGLLAAPLVHFGSRY